MDPKKCQVIWNYIEDNAQKTQFQLSYNTFFVPAFLCKYICILLSEMFILLDCVRPKLNNIQFFSCYICMEMLTTWLWWMPCCLCMLFSFNKGFSLVFRKWPYYMAHFTCWKYFCSCDVLIRFSLHKWYMILEYFEPSI